MNYENNTSSQGIDYDNLSFCENLFVRYHFNRKFMIYVKENGRLTRSIYDSQFFTITIFSGGANPSAPAG